MIRGLIIFCAIVTITVASEFRFPTTLEQEKWEPSEDIPFIDNDIITPVEQQKWELAKDVPLFDDDISYRLPTDTAPEAYDVTIHTKIHEGNFEFTGEVIISINILKDTDTITLHYRNIEIMETELTSANSEKIDVDHTTYEETPEFFKIFYGEVLPKDNKYTLKLTYKGTLRQDNRGIFRQSYTAENGQKRWLLSTHFEPTNARHAFPCYDEPALKARITIRITHDPSYHAISNMPEAGNSPKLNADGTITTFFDPTPLMSTYLTAFVVSDFEKQTQQTDKPPAHRVFSQPRLISQTDLTLDAGIKILKETGNYVGVPYSLPKMDQIAVPTFGGAMENWGLVIYGESQFFYDESVSSFRLKQGIVSLIAHEFGHQWFGDLVGPQWWSYIWLNEGFANFFEYKGVDLVRKMIRFFIFGAIVSIVTALQSPLDDEDRKRVLRNGFPLIDNGIKYRLPNNTTPREYDVTIRTKIHEGDSNFSGDVIILIYTLTDTTTITLHYRFLEIIETVLFTENGRNIDIDRTNYEDKPEFFEIFLKEVLPRDNKYTLKIKFKGSMTENNEGIFKQHYLNDKGEKRWLASTFLAPSYARQVFPCYDEPALKAQITIRITHDPSYQAISNMPEAENSPIKNADGTITTFFDPTPLMSTYLTAFVVSDFEKQTQQTDKPPVHRVFSQPRLISQTDLTLDAGIKILKETGNYVGVPYSLPKMDQIAVPTFGGAMENWGLVIYGEDPFFYDESLSKFQLKEEIYIIVAHEFGHQWFGNLVGPEWWSYIWLNEGFANYFGFKGADLVYPEMQMMDLYVTNNVQNIFNIDATPNIRPMTYYVEDPASVSGLFDSIAYGKSGSVIRMFSHAFTEDSFKKGLKYYLETKQYSDASEEDLFAALEKAAKEDKTLDSKLKVDEIMASWTQHPGFPILHVTVQTDGSINVVQERYLNNKELPVGDHKWWIPYNFVTSNDEKKYQTGTAPDGWLSEKTTKISQTDDRKWGASDWVVFNKEHSGYYRVKYDANNYKLLGDSLAKNDQTLHHLTKTQLLGDVVNFISTDRLKYDTFLSLARLLEHETEYTPWLASIGTLNTLDQMLFGTDHYDLYEKFLRTMIAKLYKSTGVDDVADEPHLRKYSRNVAIEWACAKNLEDCVTQSTDRLKKLITQGVEFHQNVRDVIYCASLRGAEQPQFTYVWNRFMSADDFATRNLLLRALTCARSENLLKRYVRSTLNSTNDLLARYRNGEEYTILLNTGISGLTGFNLVTDFIAENGDEMRISFSAAQLQSLVNNLAARVTTENLNKQLEKALTKLGDVINRDPVKATIDRNFKWQKDNAELVNEWLHTNYNDGGGGSTMINLSFALLLSAIIFNLSNYI